ncbi:hypothetical protein VF21_00361 [Pseudogymnoascus sp. 05NY08]|nr:hypothetical protein VF21_00361 [Pseudogymnoascus sp. 05NY08]
MEPIPPNIKFTPAIPFPDEFVAEKRVKQLHEFLDVTNEKYQPTTQHANILSAINAYETGLINGTTRTFFVNGKVVSQEEALKGYGHIWIEQGVALQMSSKWAYGNGVFGPKHHEVRMLLRLIPELGGSGEIHGIFALHDTGSDTLTLFDTDFSSLGNTVNYLGWAGSINVRNASGTVEALQMIIVQVKLVTYNDMSWTGWIEEFAVVRPAGLGVVRLSGMGVRDAVYWATSPVPGNGDLLAASTTKGGLLSLL